MHAAYIRRTLSRKYRRGAIEGSTPAPSSPKKICPTPSPSRCCSKATPPDDRVIAKAADRHHVVEPSNGDVGLDLVSAGTFDIYYNSTPNGDWSNPDTFSSGQQVAHFMRPESLFLQVLQTDSASPPPFESISQHALTETLVSSQSFTFKSHKYDFSALVPGGITLHELFSNTGVQGVSGFPIGLAFAGNCLAVASEGQ